MTLQLDETQGEVRSCTAHDNVRDQASIAVGDIVSIVAIYCIGVLSRQYASKLYGYVR